MVNDQIFSGGAFEKEEILFEIEPRDFQLEVDRFAADVARAQTNYNLEKAESEAALSEWRLINGDKPAPRLVARKPQLNQAWADLKGAKAQLENAKLDLERSKYVLPFNGRVLSSNLEHGQFVSAGQSYGTVYDSAGLEIQVSLKDKELEWLLNTDDPEIFISTDYLGETKTYKGVIKRQASELDNVTRFATISLGFEELPADILPGIFVKADFKGPTLENVLVVPTSSIQKGGIIWQVNDDNTITQLDGEILYFSEKETVVKAENKPTRVITNKLSGVIAGTKVEVKETKTDE